MLVEVPTYPVNLVEGQRLEDNTSHDTRTRSNGKLDLELAEEDELRTFDRGSILLPSYGKYGTFAPVVCDLGRGKLLEEVRLALGVVYVDGSSKGRVGRALYFGLLEQSS